MILFKIQSIKSGAFFFTSESILNVQNQQPFFNFFTIYFHKLNDDFLKISMGDKIKDFRDEQRTRQTQTHFRRSTNDIMTYPKHRNRWRVFGNITRAPFLLTVVSFLYIRSNYSIKYLRIVQIKFSFSRWEFEPDKEKFAFTTKFVSVESDGVGGNQRKLDSIDCFHGDLKHHVQSSRNCFQYFCSHSRR